MTLDVGRQIPSIEYEGWWMLLILCEVPRLQTGCTTDTAVPLPNSGVLYHPAAPQVPNYLLISQWARYIKNLTSLYRSCVGVMLPELQSRIWIANLCSIRGGRTPLWFHLALWLDLEVRNKINWHLMSLLTANRYWSSFSDCSTLFTTHNCREIWDRWYIDAWWDGKSSWMQHCRRSLTWEASHLLLSVWNIIWY